MTKLSTLLVLTSALALAACGGTAEETKTSNEAEDFAARINGNADAAAPIEATQTPSIVEPLPDAAPGAYSAGTATDPESATCGANRMGPFLNQPASDEVRSQIMDATADVREVRFISPGSNYVKPDPTHPRLNIMIDVTGVIRDARCG